MMRKIWFYLSAALVATAGTVSAAEFQPMGALGIGGAGVARINNAYAAYWNPAGLAFNEMAMSIPVDVSVGLRVSKGLADNVDRLAKFTENDPLTGKSAFDNLKNLNANDPKAVADMINLLSVIDDIKTKNGTLSLNQNAVVGLQIKHFATGVFMTSEGFAQPLPDMVNVLPSSTSTGTTTTPTDIYSAAGSPAPAAGYVPLFFNATQLQGIANVFTNPALGANALTPTQALALAQTIDTQMAFNPNPTGLSNAEIYNTVATTLSNQLVATSSGAGTTNTIDKNKTGLLVKSLSYIEIPIAYGHPIDLGEYGKLGIGGSLKAVIGRVYQSRLQLVESNGNSTSSGDITKNFDDNYEQTTSVTADLGLFWKYSSWLNVGLVAKNLTTPKFKSPDLKDQNGNLVDMKGNIVTVPVKDADVKLKPQMRMGIALEPWSWLTFALDYDLTKNETVLSGLNYKNQTLGGGVEIHPGSWFKIRAGAYNNLANSQIGPVGTAGLTFGLPWLNLEADGAYGFEKTTYKDKSYPREARAQVQLNIQF